MQSLAVVSGARFAGAVLNKVGSEAVLERLSETLGARSIPIVGSVRFHPELADAALAGQPVPVGPAAAEVRLIADAILAARRPVGEIGQARRGGG